MNDEKIEYTDTDEKSKVAAVSSKDIKPNRKERRHPKMLKSVMNDCISDEERAFRNRKKKLAKASKKRNR